MTSAEETISPGGDGQVTSRSRTALVIDELLSRGPGAGSVAAAASAAVTAPGGRTVPEQWSSVSPLLRDTAPSILEGHLTWLVARARCHDHLSPERVLMEDQARILIRALDERDEDEAVNRALDQPWAADGVDADDAGIVMYAWELSTRTAGHPPGSPCAALADSAGLVVAEILERRAESCPGPPTGRTDVARPAIRDRARPSYPPST